MQSFIQQQQVTLKIYKWYNLNFLVCNLPLQKTFNCSVCIGHPMLQRQQTGSRCYK